MLEKVRCQATDDMQKWVNECIDRQKKKSKVTSFQNNTTKFEKLTQLL